MSNDAAFLPDDPAVLKAMVAALQAENAKMSATIRAHDQLIQTLRLRLRLRIAKLKKQAFGKSTEKIEREIEQLELALEDLLIASAESATPPADEDEADTASDETAGEKAERKPRRRPRVSEANPAAISRQNWHRCSRCQTSGRSGEHNLRRVESSDFHLPIVISTSKVGVLRRPVESALAAAVTMMDQLVSLGWRPLADGLVQSIEDEPGRHGGRNPPANDLAGEDVDDEG